MSNATPAPQHPPPEPRWPLGLLLATCLAQLLLYAFELSLAAPPRNDHVLHLALARAVSDAWSGTGSPLDPWVPYWGQGFPVLRYYQSLPHLLVGSLHALFGGALSLGGILLSVHLLCMTLAPACFYWGARALGLERASAALTGLCWALCAADPGQRHFLGLQPMAFLWGGAGLFPQELATCLLPMALGAGVRAITTGRGVALALWLLTGLWWCHLLLGYFACLVLGLTLFWPGTEAPFAARLKRVLGLYVVLLVTTAYFTLPTLLERDWITRSTFEPSAYWDSFGADTVMAAFFSGGLLDGARLPVLTLLAVVGASLAARRADVGRAAGRFAVLALVFALLLMFGRPTWGALLALLPMSGSLPLHRVICLVQWAALLCAGIGLAAFVQRVLGDGGPRRIALSLVLGGVLLSPALLDTLEQRAQLVEQEQAAVEDHAEQGEGLRAALEDLSSLARKRPGRGYAGTSWDWGKQYVLGGVPLYHGWAGAGIPSISYLYHTMGHASEVEAYFDFRREDHYRLFNVAFAMVPDDSYLQPFMQKRGAAPGLVIATIDTPGMIELVGVDHRISLDPGAHTELLAYKRAFLDSDWHRNRRFVAIDLVRGAPMRRTVFSPTGAEWQPPRGRVLSARGRVDRFEARVQLQDEAYLLLRATMHPGFLAFVDGKLVRPEMLAPAFVGVPLTPGVHEVEVRYRASPLKPPLLLLALGMLAAASLWARRRSRAQSVG